MFLARRHLDRRTVLRGLGISLSLLTGICGAIGTFMSGVLADRYGKRDVNWDMYVPIVCTFMAIPFAPVFFFVPNTAVAVDNRGRVFTTGSRLNGGNDFDWVTLAYSRTGKLVGRAQFGGTANFIDSPSDIAVVPGGAVVTGSAANDTFDYVTIRYART